MCEKRINRHGFLLSPIDLDCERAKACAARRRLSEAMMQ